MNKASGGDGIPVELFQILKDDAVKVLHSICQQIWQTQQWPQDWKRSVFIPIPKKGNAKECSSYRTIALISHASKVMLKILQARLQQYMNHELPDVQAGFSRCLYVLFNFEFDPSSISSTLDCELCQLCSSLTSDLMRVWTQENGSTHSAVWTEQRHPQHLPDNLWLKVWADIGLSCLLNGKESSCQCRRPGFHPWVGKIPWRRKWQATPVFLPGKFHKQRSLGGLQSMGSQRVGHNLETKQQHIIRISSSPYQTPTHTSKA